MTKREHALVPRTLEVLEPAPTRVDTFSRYFLTLLVLLALTLGLGSLLGLVEIYGGLL